jgi:hypothetical protein
MSVVGPRPLAVQHNVEFASVRPQPDDHRLRNRVPRCAWSGNPNGDYGGRDRPWRHKRHPVQERVSARGRNQVECRHLRQDRDADDGPARGGGLGDGCRCFRRSAPVRGRLRGSRIGPSLGSGNPAPEREVDGAEGDRIQERRRQGRASRYRGQDGISRQQTMPNAF